MNNKITLSRKFVTEVHEEIKLPAFFKDERGEVFIALLTEKYGMKVFNYDNLASISYTMPDIMSGYVQCDKLEFAAAYGQAEAKINMAFTQLEEATK